MTAPARPPNQDLACLPELAPIEELSQGAGGRGGPRRSQSGEKGEDGLSLLERDTRDLATVAPVPAESRALEATAVAVKKE